MKKINTILLFVFFALSFFNSYSQCSVTIGYTNGSNGTVNFTSNVTGGGTYTYSWSFGDGSYASTTNPSHTYIYNYTYSACLYVYDSISCSDSTCLQVTVTNAAQTVSCPGNAAFTTSPNGTSTNFINPSGNWMIADFGDGMSSPLVTGTIINHQYLMNGTYQVTSVAYGYFGSNYFPCDTSVQTINVTNVPCQAAFTAWTDTSVNSIYCNNQSLGAANTTWYVDGNVAASNIDNFYSGFLLPGTHTVCLVITGNGCYDSTCQNITLTGIIPCPGVTFAYAPLSGCDSYQFTINNTGPPLSSVDWYHNVSWIGSGLTIPVTLDFTSAQNNVYSESVSVMVQGTGCTLSQNFSFVNPASFWINLDTSTVTGNTWYAFPQNVSGITSELWDFGDGSTSTLSYPSHIYAVSGFYDVCHTITVNATCNYTYCINQYFYRGAQSQGVCNFVVVGPTGIEQNTEVNTIKIYPNPSSDFIQFDFGNFLHSEITLDIYNSIGEVVKSASIKQGENRYELNIKNLAPGIYYYKLTGNNMNGMQGKIFTAD